MYLLRQNVKAKKSGVSPKRDLGTSETGVTLDIYPGHHAEMSHVRDANRIIDAAAKRALLFEPQAILNCQKLDRDMTARRK